MSTYAVDKGPSIRDQVSADEWQARLDLAAGHRVLSYYGVNDMTYNHFSLRVPGEPTHLLIKPTDYMFGEVTASSLLKYDLDGNPVLGHDTRPLKGGGLIIHAGLLKTPARSQQCPPHPHPRCHGRGGAPLWLAPHQSTRDALLRRAEISRFQRIRV